MSLNFDRQIVLAKSIMLELAVIRATTSVISEIMTDELAKRNGRDSAVVHREFKAIVNSKAEAFYANYVKEIGLDPDKPTDPASGNTPNPQSPQLPPGRF